jgi:hypothetical protein
MVGFHGHSGYQDAAHMVRDSAAFSKPDASRLEDADVTSGPQPGSELPPQTGMLRVWRNPFVGLCSLYVYPGKG